MFPAFISCERMMQACKANLLSSPMILQRSYDISLLYRIDPKANNFNTIKNSINETCSQIGVYTLYSDSLIINVPLKSSDVLHKWNRICNEQISFLPSSLVPLNGKPSISDNHLSNNYWKSVIYYFGRNYNIELSTTQLYLQLFWSTHLSLEQLTHNDF